MEFSIFAQTFFYLTASIAIIVFGALCAIVLYRLIKIMKHLEKISESLDDTAGEVGDRIRDMLNGLENLPLLSYFFKKRSHRLTGIHHPRKKVKVLSN